VTLQLNEKGSRSAKVGEGYHFLTQKCMSKWPFKETAKGGGGVGADRIFPYQENDGGERGDGMVNPFILAVLEGETLGGEKTLSAEEQGLVGKEKAS